MEENFRALGDVLQVVHKSYFNTEIDIKSSVRKFPNIVILVITSKNYQDQRERILRYELKVLQSLGFDLVVEHPHVLLLSMIKGFQLQGSLE